MKNEPAFPTKDVLGLMYSGLTKRELLAAMAMQGLLNNISSLKESDWIGQKTPQFMAELSAQSADALIAELEKSNERS